MYQGIFIDTHDANERFAELMSTKGRAGLKVKFQNPCELLSLGKEILNNEPDLVALDYRLNNTRKKRSSYYTAGALAQQLRDAIMESITKDFPIILVSNEKDINTFFNNVTAHSLFDIFFIKEEIDNGSIPNQKILSLVKGYKYLIKNWHKPERWATIFKLRSSEKIRVGYQAIRELDTLKAPHQVIHEILRYVIDRPGILLDDNNLLAYMGIAETSKNVDKLFDILREEKVAYTGIFSEGWIRWWQHRLERWEKKLGDDTLGNMTAKQRVSYLNKKLGLQLSPAKSRWNNHTDTLVSFTCASCHQPTEKEFSVAAYDPLPNTFTFVHRKSICFSCIQTGEFAEKGLKIDENEGSIIEKLQND